MVDVLLVDDHAMFRDGLRQILEETSDIVVAGEASNAQEAMDKIDTHKYDVVVLDISLPGRSGLDVLKECKEIQPDIDFLILSMHSEEQYAFRVFKAGAAGYLTKNVAASELIQAIRTVSAGRKYISTEVAEQLASHLIDDLNKPQHEQLSDRELQVMCFLASGKTVNEIANKLSLSVSTVSTNRARMLKKMNMKNNAEIKYYAIKLNLVS